MMFMLSLKYSAYFIKAHVKISKTVALSFPNILSIPPRRSARSFSFISLLLKTNLSV